MNKNNYSDHSDNINGMIDALGKYIDIVFENDEEKRHDACIHIAGYFILGSLEKDENGDTIFSDEDLCDAAAEACNKIVSAVKQWMDQQYE